MHGSACASRRFYAAFYRWHVSSSCRQRALQCRAFATASRRAAETSHSSLTPSPATARQGPTSTSARQLDPNDPLIKIPAHLRDGPILSPVDKPFDTFFPHEQVVRYRSATAALIQIAVPTVELASLQKRFGRQLERKIGQRNFRARLEIGSTVTTSDGVQITSVTLSGSWEELRSPLDYFRPRNPGTWFSEEISSADQPSSSMPEWSKVMREVRGDFRKLELVLSSIDLASIRQYMNLDDLATTCTVTLQVVPVAHKTAEGHSEGNERHSVFISGQANGVSDAYLAFSSRKSLARRYPYPAGAYFARLKIPKGARGNNPLAILLGKRERNLKRVRADLVNLDVRITRLGDTVDRDTFRLDGPDQSAVEKGTETIQRFLSKELEHDGLPPQTIRVIEQGASETDSTRSSSLTADRSSSTLSDGHSDAKNSSANDHQNESISPEVSNISSSLQRSSVQSATLAKQNPSYVAANLGKEEQTEPDLQSSETQTEGGVLAEGAEKVLANGMPNEDIMKLALSPLSHPVVIITAMLPMGAQSGLDNLLPLCRGVTVSSFNSVTLKPTPIVSFNIKTPSRTWEAIKTSGSLIAHVLNASPAGAALAHQFTLPHQRPEEAFRRAQDMGAYIGVYTNNTRGSPRIKFRDAVLCVIQANVQPQKCVPVGDHMIVVAEVSKVKNVESISDETAGLAYARRQYRGIGAQVELAHISEAVSDDGVAEIAGSAAHQGSEAAADVGGVGGLDAQVDISESRDTRTHEDTEVDYFQAFAENEDELDSDLGPVEDGAPRGQQADAATLVDDSDAARESSSSARAESSDAGLRDEALSAQAPQAQPLVEDSDSVRETLAAEFTKQSSENHVVSQEHVPAEQEEPKEKRPSVNATAP